MAPVSATQHHVIREAGDSIGQLLVNVFKDNGYKRVHLVLQPPKQDAVEGKLPALCVYLYNLVIDELGAQANMSPGTIETDIGPDGRPREVLKAAPVWIRLDYLI